jgi:predicted small secreted protein
MNRALKLMLMLLPLLAAGCGHTIHGIWQDTKEDARSVYSTVTDADSNDVHAEHP